MAEMDHSAVAVPSPSTADVSGDAGELLTTSSKLLASPLHPSLVSVTRHSSFSSHSTPPSSTSTSPLTTSRPSSAHSSATSTPSSASPSSSSQPTSPHHTPDDDRPLPTLAHLQPSPTDSISRPPSPFSPPVPSTFVPHIPRIRADGYVGIHNQGATCYLNSLLQSLFFTPEFRTALLFRWEYVPGVHPPPLLCIPYQLQLLFARLLCSVRPAVETAALTKSFRWTDAESFRQHDIQELMRVLFAALEKTLAKKTSKAPTLARINSSSSVSSSPSSTPSSPTSSPQHSPTPSSPMSPTSLSSSFPSLSPTSPSFVHQLYCGTLVDYVTCLQCRHGRQRLDEFMDLSLDVAECDSLEQALGKFVQSETLTGDNRWRCDVCKEKVEAKKGLTFHKLPPILTIQLKRFVFDHQLQQRSKLQHRVTFPEMIDMAPFIQPELAVTANGSLLSSTSSSSSASSSPSPSSLLYDLFAVLMHSGTANGGHYFSYIRSEQGPFFEFNDTNVWHVPDNALELAFGGGKGACAYLLIYRSRELELARVRGPDGGADSLLPLDELEKVATTADGGWQLMKERGVRGADDDKEERRLRRLAEVALLPPAVKAIIEAEDEVHLRQHAEQEKERRRMEVTVVYATSEHTFHFDQEQRMADCLQTAAAHFALPSTTSLDCLRFRRYDRQHEWSAEPYPASLTLIQCHFSKRNTVRLELREPDEDWPAFNPNLIPLRVIHAHADNLQSIIEHATSYPHSTDSVTLSVDCTQPLSALSSLIEPAFSIPIHRQRLIRLHDDRGEVVSDLTVTPQSVHLTAGQLLYVEDTGDMQGEPHSALQASASASPLCSQLDLSRCQIKLLFNLPVQADTADDAAPSTDAAECVSYEQAVHVSKHQSVRYLKSLIAPIISLPPSAFRLSRNESAAHFKDLDATLTQAGLVDYSAVHVSVGRQCDKDEFNLKVFLMQSAAPARSSSSYLYLFDLPIPSTSSIAQLKMAMLAHLNTHFGDVRGTGNGIGLTFFRLREKKGNLSSRVFEDSRTVAEVLQDEADVCIERCDNEEEARVKKDSCLLRWAWWDGKALGPERELLVRKMVMVGALRDDIRSAWLRKHPHSGVCPPVFLAKGMARVRMRPSDVAKVQWMGEEELADTKLAKNLPLRLAAGDLLIASIIPPPSHIAKPRKTSLTDAAPEAPPLAPPPPPPPPPPGPPPAPTPGAASVSVNKPPESVISAAKSRLKRAVGVKGFGDAGVSVKGARIYPAREYGLHIDNIEDEIEAIERACAEADQMERQRKEEEEMQQRLVAAKASDVEPAEPAPTAPALNKEAEEHKDLEPAQ